MTKWQKLLAWAAVQNWHWVIAGIGASLTVEQVVTATTIAGKVQAFFIAFLMYLARPSQTSGIVEKISDAIPGRQPPAPPSEPTPPTPPA